MRCPACNKYFPNRLELWQHDLDAHEGKNFIKCPLCPLKIRNQGHVQSVHKIEKGFECPDCKIPFETPLQLKRHIQHGHTEGRFRCPVANCKSTVKQKCNINRHREQEHDKSFECGDCPLRFQLFAELTAHRDAEHAEGRFKCPLCTTTLTIEKNIWLHIRRWHPDSRLVECERCDERFNCPSEMEKHKYSHYPADFICLAHGCNAKFDFFCTYDEHYQRNHATIAEKLAFSRNPANRWLYKMYLIRSLQENSFKIGITRRPLRDRLKRYREEGYTHELVYMWQLPLEMNEHRCYAHQFENKVHLEVVRKLGFETVRNTREFFNFWDSPLDETHFVCDVINEQLLEKEFSEPLRISNINSKNKLYLIYSQKHLLAKVGYTTMSMKKRLNSINTGEYSVVSGGHFVQISLIHVDTAATVHELKAWENDILIRFHKVFGLVSHEYFNCAKDMLKTAQNVFQMQ